MQLVPVPNGFSQYFSSLPAPDVASVTRAIDKYAFQLSALLKSEAAKSRKQRRTLKQMPEDLKDLGARRSRGHGGRGQTERANPASKRTDHVQIHLPWWFNAAKQVVPFKVGHFLILCMLLSTSLCCAHKMT